MSSIPTRAPNESEHDYLFRLGDMKESGAISSTWWEIGVMLNAQLSKDLSYETWRKKYSKLKSMVAIPTEEEVPSAFDAKTVASLDAIAMQKIRLKAERSAIQRRLKEAAQRDDWCSTIVDAIKKFDDINMTMERVPSTNADEQMLIMLSDIHYGLSFHNMYASYDTDIAHDRLVKYFNSIIDIQSHTDCKRCRICLMGDLISGGMHKSIRIENKENIVQQIIGVSEQISNFICDISRYFDEVIVTNVDGNHSRIESCLDDALRGERLDSIIPWYCKAKLRPVTHVKFEDNHIDSTISVFDILGKTYVAVHGDFDFDLSISANRLSTIVGRHVDYMLAGHMHVADMRFEEVPLIRNGALVTGGDEYTAKKRLFAPAIQTCMICDSNGVKSIHPIKLS